MKTQPTNEPELAVDQAIPPIEEYRAEDKEWLLEVVQNANEVIIVTQDGFIKFCNPKASHFSGYSSQELTSKIFTEFIHPHDRDMVLEANRHRLRGDIVPQVYTFRIIDKAEQVKWVEHVGVRIMWEGKPATLSCLNDITERKQAEEEIRRRNRELALLNRVIAASATHSEMKAILEIACRELAQAFEVPHATVALLNDKKNTANVAAEYLAENSLTTLHLTIPLADDPLFQHLLSYKAPLVTSDAQNDPNLVPLYELLRQRGIVSLLYIPLLIDREVVGGLGLESLQPRHFSSEEVSLAWSVADQVAGVLARTRLEAERQRWEEQYYQAQKMEAMGRLTAGIVHDFNNMLTTINGFAALIQDQFPPDDPIREMINKVLRSGEHAADLVRHLLAFSRKQMIEPQVLNLNTIVADIDKMLRRIIGEDINLKTVLAQELWPIKVDPTHIEQIIMNLAVNARDAMPGGGQLTIETANVTIYDDYTARHFGTKPGEHVLLAISDTGCGMSPEVKSHLFEPFFTTKEASKGTGLGLATVYGIIKQSGGHIWVYSEEGIGTVFKIYLPRAMESKYSPTLAGIDEKTPSGHETILVVDDNIPVRDLVRRILQKQGYILLEAQNGEEALRLITNYAGPIHLLLTDIVMPGISGKTLAEEAAHLRPDMKVLYISGYTDETITDHGAIEPGDAFLQKPFNPTALGRKVRFVLDT